LVPRSSFSVYGLNVEDKLIIHQRNYIRRLLERFNAPENPVATPLDPKQPLVEASETGLLNLNEENALEYRATVGALMYFMLCTRPDLAFTIFFQPFRDGYLKLDDSRRFKKRYPDSDFGDVWFCKKKKKYRLLNGSTDILTSCHA
jgi:hypothetical protein